MVASEKALKAAGISAIVTVIVAYIVDVYVWSKYSDTQSPYIVAAVLGAFIFVYAYYGMTQ